jgi:arylsulfatase A-like enzyme
MRIMQKDSRRNFIGQMAAGAAATSLPLSNCATAPRPRPNILYIMSDDHAAPAIGAYGSKINQTPNIDRIAHDGIRLDNCFCTNSICTPSRATILTGKYSHINGATRFNEFDPKHVTLQQLLQQSGYETAMIGKWHLHRDPSHFDYWNVLPGQGKYHDPAFIEMGERKQYQGYATDIITDITLDYLDRRDETKPFFLCYQHKAPHDPFEYDDKHSHMYEDGDIPEPPTLFDDHSGHAKAVGASLQGIGVGVHTIYEEKTGHLKGIARKKAQYQEYIKSYLRCVASVDDNVGRVLDYLDDNGLTENTIVIYTSDQGFFLGEHGWYDKRFMFEEALRMPFLMRYPGVTDAGSTSGAMVLNVDFAPTLLDYAGVATPADMQGRSARAVLEGEVPDDWRKSMYYRYYRSHFNQAPHYGVRTDRYKLICFHGHGEWNLFDLEKDPLEMQSVYDDPAYASVVAELKTELERLRRELGDTDVNESDEAWLKEHPDMHKRNR